MTRRKLIGFVQTEEQSQKSLADKHLIRIGIPAWLVMVAVVRVTGRA